MAALDLAAAGFGSAETNAVQLGKALQDPIKGLTALARSGVTFTEVEREKIKAMVESGNILGAQEAILKAIETQVGGTAEATATGSAKMSVAFGEMQEAIGTALLPLFEKLVPLVTGFLEWIGKNSVLVTVLAGAMGVLAAAILAVNFALNANPIVKVITLIAALVTGVILLIDWLVKLYGGWDKLFKDLGKWLTSIGQFFATIWNGVSNVFKGVIDRITGWWTAYVTALTNGISRFGDFFAKIWNGLGNIARGALNGVISFVEGWINRIINGVNTLINLINKVLSVGKVIGISLQIPKLSNIQLPRLAEGGIVMPQPGGVLAQIAEAGQPEAVIPLDRLGQFGGGGGNTYNITVNGGLNSGANIGKAVVDAIKAYERSSGAVWVSA
jgi:phage-related protein